MADKKTESKIILERTYNVPLRKGFQKAPKYRRTKKAVNVLREFLSKHMKSDNIKIGRYLNLKLWEDGIKNPPHHVKVNVTKDSEGVVKAEIVGAPEEKKAEAPKKRKVTEKKGEEGIEKALEELKEKTDKIKEEQKDKAKEVQEEEIKALKDNPAPAAKEAKQPKPKVEKHQTDIDAKTEKKPHGGQTMEKHHGEGKQKPQK